MKLSKPQATRHLISMYNYVFRVGVGPGYSKVTLSERQYHDDQLRLDKSSAGWPHVHRPRGLWKIHLPEPAAPPPSAHREVAAALMSLSSANGSIAPYFVTPNGGPGSAFSYVSRLSRRVPPRRVRRPKTEQEAVAALRVRADALESAHARSASIYVFSSRPYTTLALASVSPRAREYVRGNAHLMADAGLDALEMLRPLLQWRFALLDEMSRYNRYFEWEDHFGTLAQELGAWALCAFRLVNLGTLTVLAHRLRVLRVLRYGSFALWIHNYAFHINFHADEWTPAGYRCKEDMRYVSVSHAYMSDRRVYTQRCCPAGGHTSDFESMGAQIELLSRRDEPRGFDWSKRLRVGHARRHSARNPPILALRTWFDWTRAWAQLVWKVANKPRGRRDGQLASAQLGRNAWSKIRRELAEFDLDT